MGANFHIAPTDQSKWRVTDVEAWLGALDNSITYMKNIIIHCDGDVAYNDLTGVLSWTGILRILFNREDGDVCENTIAIGNITLADNQFCYVDLNDTNGTALTIAKATITPDGVSNTIAVNRLVLGYRNTTSNEYYPVSLHLPSGGGGHEIQDEGSPMTQRSGLDFVGSNVAVTDDSGNDKTVVTIGEVNDGFNFPLIGEHIDYLHTTISSSAYAWKGNYYLPKKSGKIYGVGVLIDPAVSGATYQGAVFEKDGSHIITSITKTEEVVLDHTERTLIWMWFTTPVSFTAGTKFGIMAGRNDSTDTYGFPTSSDTGENPSNFNAIGGNADDTYGIRIAKANPAVDDTIDVTTGQFGTVVCFSLDSAPIFSDADSIHASIGGEIAAITEKTTPIAADLVLIEDSEASDAKKRIQLSNLPDVYKRVFNIALTASDADVAVVDGTYAFCVPEALAGMNIIDVVATVHTAGTTGTTDIQVRRRRDTTDADVLSTKVTIDSGETSSITAAIAFVVNTANDDLAEGDLIFIDIDAISTTAPKGLFVTVTAQLP